MTDSTTPAVAVPNAPSRAAESAIGLGATLSRLWAVARLTLLEAVRRRVFVLLLLFGAAIVSSATFFPAIDAESRLRLIEVWSVRASLLFAVIVSIFLAGFSLPGDFETRRVYTLVTKPLHKMTLFGGKFIGFFLLLAVFLGSMALMSVGYIRGVSLLSRDFPALKAEPRFFAQTLRGEGREGTDWMRFGDSGRLGARRQGVLAWRFSGLSRSDFADPLRMKVKLNLGRMGKQWAIEGTVAFRAVNLQTGEGLNAPKAVMLHTNQEAFVEFPAGCVGDDGSLDIVAVPGENDLTFDGDAQGVVLYGRSTSFELNYLRGMILVLFQSTVVMAVTLAASTFLTAPMSIVCGIFLYIVGGMWGHINEGVRDIDTQMETFRAQLAKGQVQQAYTPEGLPPWLLDASTAVSRVMLQIVPDFSRFNFSDYLLNDHAVMTQDLLGGFGTMAARVAVLLAIGLAAMLFKEIAI